LAREGGELIEGAAPPLKVASPSPFKERGIKGARFKMSFYKFNNLK